MLRDVTERPELVEAGAGRLVGCDPDRILGEASRLLDSAEARAAMGRPRGLFGDGRAGERIAAALAGDAPVPWTPESRAPAPRP